MGVFELAEAELGLGLRAGTTSMPRHSEASVIVNELFYLVNAVPPAGFEPATHGLGRFARASTWGVTRHPSFHMGLLRRPLTSRVITVSFPEPFPGRW